MKVLSPKEYQKRQYPSVDDLHNAIVYISENLDPLILKGDIIGATSCGSFFLPDHLVDILSDIDWLIVFSSLEKQLSSSEFQRILSYLKEKNIPFFNPVLSIEAIKTKNHIIAPIIHGIKQAKERIIQGEDPVALLEKNGTKKNDLEIISRLFSTFTRYFFEYLLYNKAKEPEDVTNNIQTSLGFYTDTYRTMIVLQCATDDFDTILDITTYLDKYKKCLPPNIINTIEKIERFKIIYKQMIYKEVKLNEYIDFINEYRGIALKIAEFCNENILIFNKFYKTKQCQSS